MPHAPQHKRQLSKNLALALMLLGLMGIIFAVTVIRLGG